jgi:hypothetical protein
VLNRQDAPLRDPRPGEDLRGGAPQVPLPRPAPPGDAAQPDVPPQVPAGAARRPPPGVRRGGDPLPRRRRRRGAQYFVPSRLYPATSMRCRSRRRSSSSS